MDSIFINRGMVISKYWLLIIITFSIGQSFAQTDVIDSLEIRLRNAQQDTSRVFFLCELSSKFLAYRPSLSKQYAEEALKLSRKMNFKRGEMLALNRLGEYEFRQSNYAHAIELLTQSLKQADELHDPSAVAAVYRLLGNVNSFGLKQYDKALKYQFLALSIYEKKKDMANIAALFGNISWIYATTNQNLEEAEQLARRGVQIADSLRIDKLLSYNYNSLGLIFMKKELFDSALYFLDRSNEIATHIMDRSVNSYNNIIKGNIFLLQKEYKKAQQIFMAAEMESREINSREVLKDSYNGLAKAYEELGNYQLALTYHKMFNELQDTLLNWETTQKALMMEHDLNEQRREVRIAELERLATKARLEKKVYSSYFSIVMIALLIILILIIRNNRQRRLANELLVEKNNAIAEQNLQLTQANEIKDKLFFIIGHDLRGPLSSLKALLGMLTRNEVTDHEFKSFAPQLNQHVVGINETLENLLQWSGSQMHGWQHQPTNFLIRPVIDKVLSLLSETAHRKQIDIHHQVDNDLLVFADAYQMELVFRNLIHNAIKFTPEGGSISVSSLASGDFIDVAITDTGVGIAPDQLASLFEEPSIRNTRGTKGERGTGLGLTLCYEMIQTNNGQIRVESKAGGGTTVHVSLKAANHAPVVQLLHS